MSTSFKEPKQLRLEITSDLLNDSSKSDVFWQTLASTVIDLDIDKGVTDGEHVREKLDRFVGLIKLRIATWQLCLLSPYFYKNNKNLAIVEIYTNSLRDTSSSCIFWEGENVSVLPGFELFLQQSPGLEIILFPCFVPYHRATLQHFNKLLRIDDIAAEFDVSLTFKKYYIRDMKMEIVEQSEGVRRAFLRVIEILAFGIECTRCTHKSAFSSTVRRICFGPYLCLECFDVMIKSFPSTKMIENDHSGFDSTSIKKLSEHLPHLTHLSTKYSGDLNLWPVFEQLKCLKIDLCCSPDAWS